MPQRRHQERNLLQNVLRLCRLVPAVTLGALMRPEGPAGLLPLLLLARVATAGLATGVTVPGVPAGPPTTDSLLLLLGVGTGALPTPTPKLESADDPRKASSHDALLPPDGVFSKSSKVQLVICMGLGLRMFCKSSLEVTL